MVEVEPNLPWRQWWKDWQLFKSSSPRRIPRLYNLEQPCWIQTACNSETQSLLWWFELYKEEFHISYCQENKIGQVLRSPPKELWSIYSTLSESKKHHNGSLYSPQSWTWCSTNADFQPDHVHEILSSIFHTVFHPFPFMLVLGILVILITLVLAFWP